MPHRALFPAAARRRDSVAARAHPLAPLLAPRLRVVLFRLLVTLTLTAFAPVSSGAAAASPRVAILADGPIAAGPVPDLLAAALSKDPAVALVERAELNRVGAERALIDWSAPASSARRRELGTLLHATTLLLLAEVAGPDNDRALRAIVVDTRTGARLAIHHRPAKEGAGETAAQIARLTRETLHQFEAGVRAIVAVPPFLSRALTHEFDPWQPRCALLVESSLLQQPGLAVLELEEANAIRQELALAPAGNEARAQAIVALSVHGGFTPAAGRTLSFRVELQDARTTIAALEHPGLALPHIASWLRTNVAPRILSAIAPGTAVSLSPVTQRARLLERAEDFARVGSHEPSTHLREAALLLQEDDVPQRRLLIGEYQRLIVALNHRSERSTRPSPRVETVDPDPIEARRARWLALRRRQLDHFDHLVLNRQIPAEEIESILSRIRPSLPSSVVPDSSPEGREWKAELRARTLARLPHWLALTRELTARDRQLYLQQRILTEETQSALWARPDDLEFLTDLWAKLPADVAPLGGIGYFVARPPADPSNPQAMKEELAFGPFLERLRASPHPLARLHGRFGALYREQLRRDRSPATNEVLLQEARSLQADFASHWTTQRISRSEQGPLPQMLSDLIGRLERDLRPPQAPPRFASPRAPAETNTGRLRITPLPIQLRTLAGEVRPWSKEIGPNRRDDAPKWPSRSGFQAVSHWRAAGPKLDVLWTPGALLFHRSPEVIEEIDLSPRIEFEDVAWDGHQVWVATRHGGVRIYSREGQLIGTATAEHGLPPASLGVRLHAASPGTAIVVGAFGENSRAWCARIRWSATETNVHVFHTATRVRDASLTFGDPGGVESDYVFAPTWLHLLQSPSGPPRLLVGRNATSREGRRFPLSIDPASLTVNVHPAELGEDFASDSFFSGPGGLLRCHRNGVTLFPHPAPQAPVATAHPDPRGLCRPTGPDAPGGIGPCAQLLHYAGKVYVPGLIWFRIDPVTLAEEQLTPRRLPLPGRDFRHFAVSAHHGLVGWDYGRGFHQVQVDDVPQPAATPAPSAPSARP